MVLFLRKKPAAPSQTAQGYVPVDLVQRMASTGMAEPEIASYLGKQGFSSAQIDTAMREALKAQVSAPPMQFMQAPPGPMSQEETEVNVPATPTMNFPGPAEMPGAPPEQMPYPVQRQPSPQPQRPAYPAPTSMPPRRPLGLMPPREAMRASREDIGVPPERIMPASTRPVQYSTAPTEEEMMGGRQPRRIPESASEITLEEIVEGIVAEHWSEFEDRLSNFEKRDIQLQSQIQDLKKAIGELEGKQTAREADMITRLEGMGESMTGIQGRIGSIEKVFRDFLPQMTENVRTMADVVEKLRAGK